MKILFLDESGDDNMSDIDKMEYPMFVLGGVIMSKDYIDDTLTDELDSFKEDFFGTKNIILHTADIKRKQNGFEILNNKERKKEFLTKINNLMSKLEYSVISCAVSKDEFSSFLSRSNLKSLDLYHLSFSNLVERFVRVLSESNEEGMIIAESRDPGNDQKLKNFWKRIKKNGTINFTHNHVNDTIKDFEILGKKASKKVNLAKKEYLSGLQLADLVVTPIGYRLLGRPQFPDWKIVEKKLEVNSCIWLESGIIEFPKNII